MNVQTYSRKLNNDQHALILNSHHCNIKKKKLGKEIIHACKIHMAEEETFGGDPKSGVEKKN